MKYAKYIFRIRITRLFPCNILLIALFSLFYANGQSQCNNHFYDTGGALNDYSNNEDFSETHTVTSGYKVKLSFVSFRLESGYDFLRVYDGPSTASTLIGEYSGTSIPDDIISSGNELTVRFISDYSIVDEGFDYEITRVKTYQVSADSDDMEEHADGSLAWGSSDLELTQESSIQEIGIRFTSIDLTQGTQLESAYMIFHADESNSESTVLLLHGELIANSPTYSNSNKVSTRTVTSTDVTWSSIPAWSTGNYYTSPDIKDIIQEITSLPGWNYDNALSIIITGSGKRVAESHEGNGTPVTLVIEECVACKNVGEWKLDDNANDSSPFANHGTEYGNPTYSQGIIGSAIDFDGSGDYVSLGNPSDLQITGNMTIAMWINPDDFSIRRSPFGKAYGGIGSITQELDGDLNFYWGISGANASPFSFIRTNTPLQLNTWTHIALVKDYTNSVIKWYINGVEDASQTLSMSTVAGSLDYYLGTGYTNDYDGQIDEFKLYDCALTAAEVAELYSVESSTCDVTIRALGSCGGEQISLLLDGINVATYTLTTSYQDFIYSGFKDGQTVAVEFTDGNNGCDLNARIDYVIVDQQTLHTEAVGSHSNPSCNSGEWLYCTGTVSYGTRYCNIFEICNNGLDDDGDGFIDCLDGDCADSIYCDFDPDVCYFIADGASNSSSPDLFYTYNHITKVVTLIGPTGTTDIEAMAINLKDELIYSCTRDSLGIISPVTGQFTPISTNMGQVDGADGLVDAQSFDGMTYDTLNNIIWATIRREGGSNGEPDDLLVKVNPYTGMPVLNAFGPGIDYVIVPTNENDIDDIAIDENGVLYAISNYGSSGNQKLGTINTSTGEFTEIGDYGIEDVESLTFTGSGQLLASTGQQGAHSNSLYSIDAGTGIATFVGDLSPGLDVEGCECINSVFANMVIGDRVWEDMDADGIQDIDEPGVRYATVNLLYSDNSPVLDKDNNPITTLTDFYGYYNFGGLYADDYVVEFVLPSGASFTTQDAGGDDAFDSDAGSDGKTNSITLSGSVNNYTVDAGMINSGTPIRTCSDEGELLVTVANGYILRFAKETGALIDTFAYTQGESLVDMVVGPDDFLYVSSLNNSRINKYSLKSGVLIEYFEIPGLDEPRGLTFTPGGDLLINDRLNDDVWKLNVTTGSYEIFINSGGPNSPRNGIEIGPDGNIYAGSRNNDQILKYDITNGNYLGVFASTNIDGPWDFTFAPDGTMWVVNYDDNNATRYDGTTGAFIDEIISFQSGGLNGPVSIQFANKDTVYIATQNGTDGVYRYDANTGAFIDLFVNNITDPESFIIAPVPDCIEICDNGIDDDGDGYLDCADSYCNNGLNLSSSLTNDDFCPGGSTQLEAIASSTDGISGYQWSNGLGTSPIVNVSPTSSTTYSVTVTNNSGCTIENELTVTVKENAYAGAITGDEINCIGFDPAGIVSTINPSGTNCGPSGLDYQWQRKVNDLEWVDLPGGNGLSYDPDMISATTSYRRVVTNCCNIDTSNIVVKTVNPPIGVNALGETTICQGDSILIQSDLVLDSIEGGFLLTAYDELNTNDYISFTSTGSNQPRLEIYLDNNPTPVILNPTKIAKIESFFTNHTHFDVIGVGYDFAETDHERGLINFDFSSLSGEVTQANLILNSTSSGNLDIAIYPITQDWVKSQVTWNDYATNQMWDYGGVKKTDEVAIDVSNASGPGDVTWDVTTQVEFWLNGDSHLAANYTYSWSNGYVGKSQYVSPGSTMNYYVTVTSNNTGCENLDSVSINVLEAPNASISNNGVITCQQDTVTIMAIPGGMTYNWSDGSSGQINEVTSPGTYFVTVTNVNGCTEILSDSVTIDTIPPIANAGSDQLICAGDSVTLSVTGVGVYNWSNGSNSNSIIVSPVVTTEYIVTVTKSNGCFDIDTVQVNVNPSPNYTLSKDGNIQCDNDTVALNVSLSGMEYLWNTSDTTQMINVSSGGTYSVTVTNSFGCSIVDQIVVDEYLSSTPIECDWFTITEYGVESDTIDFNGTCEITICENDSLSDIHIQAGPILNNNWVWTDEDGNVAGENTGGATFENLRVEDSGIYSGEYTNEYGCVSAIHINVMVNPTPVAEVTDDGPFTCFKDSIRITAAPGGLNYNWSTGDTVEFIDVTNPGTYTATVTNTFGCFDQDSIVVDSFTCVEICDNGIDDDGNGLIDCFDPYCNTSGMTVTPAVVHDCEINGKGEITLNVSGGQGAYTYEWTDISSANAIWRFNQSTDDNSGNGNNLIQNGSLGTPQFSNDAKEGSHSLYLDGSTYLRYSKDAAFMEVALNQWMMSFWMKPSNYIGIQQIVDEGDATNGLGIRINDESLEFSVRDDGVQVDAVPHIIPNDGQWHHVLAYYENDSIGLYLDGIKSASVYCGFPGQEISAHNGNGGIGYSDGGSGFGGGSGSFYTGLIDEVRYYSNSGFNPGVIYDLAQADGSRSNLSVGTYEVTVKDSTGQCVTESGIILNEGLPAANAGLDTTTCIGNFVLLSATGGTSYLWSTGSSSNTTIVAPSSTTSYIVTVTDDNNCVAEDTVVVNINQPINVIIDYNGNPCAEANSTISAEANGGSGNYYYSWTGPNSFISSSDTVTIVDDGNYYVTVSDQFGCEASTSGFVYEAYNPFIFSLNTTICEGESVDLEVNSPSAVAFQWGPNANNDTTKDVTVTPLPPATTYMVTVTNDVGCNTTATTIINVIEKTIVDIVGPPTVCLGDTSQLSPNTGGNWVSTNPSVAVVTSSGAITSVGPGTSAFVFTEDTTNCDSDPTAFFTVLPLPSVNVSGPTSICEGFTTELSPNTGGTWISTNPGVATVTDDGLVTGISAGTATFIFTDTATLCTSLETSSITVHPIPVVNFTGQDSICVGENSTIIPGSGGIWTSVNPAVANISNNGIITGISAGEARFVYLNTSTNCLSDTSSILNVFPIPEVSITGTTEVCEGSTTTLAPTSGGTWVSNNPSIATVMDDGTVTAVTGGLVNFTFTSIYGCSSDVTDLITVENNGTIFLSGDTLGCVAEDISLSTSIPGGIWMSSDTSIAIVDNSGIVSPVSSGFVTISYNDNSVECYIEPTIELEIRDLPVINISGEDSLCIGDNTYFTPSTGGVWSSNDPSVAFITDDGIVTALSDGVATFNFTSDSTSCTSDTSTNIYVSPVVGVQIDFNGSVCLEDTTQLTASLTGGTAPYTYNWDGPAGFDSDLPTIDVPTDGNYYVTVLDAFGCQTNSSAFVYESYNPVIFGLNTDICEGEQVTLSVNSGSAVAYQWGANAGFSTSSIVTVTPSPPSTHYHVTVTNGLGCDTDANAIINVTPKPVVSITGPDAVCEGDTTYLSPSTGGLWISNNNGIATVDDQGIVIGVSAGSVNFAFRDTSTGCWSDTTNNITINPNGTINISGDNSGCVGDSLTLSASVSGGYWISNNPALATVDPVTGAVNLLAPGTVTISYFDNSPACYDIAQHQITINNNPTVTFTGISTICMGSTTNLSPTTGGVWESSDTSIATVNNSGLVTGVNGGTALFTFTSNEGCSSTTLSPVYVVNDPAVSITGPSGICIGDMTSLSPTSGGIWISSNNGIANVNPSGTVTGVSAGVATFSFYESTNGCLASQTLEVEVYSRPSTSFSGPTTLCIGDSTQINSGNDGIWFSDNPAVATVDSSGLIIAISSGNARFTFTDTLTGCSSFLSAPVTVNPKPVVSIFGQTDVCVGDQITISPNSGGVWLSENPTVATITNAGIITGINVGSTYFIFTNSNTGCVSDPTDTITVRGPTTVSYNGPSEACVGDTISLLPDTGGSWISSNPAIATITSDGKVNTLAAGSTNFVFTNYFGCSSSPNPSFSVLPLPTPTYIGPTAICITGNTYLSPVSGGTWESTDTTVATITNAGIVTGVGVGTAKFIFTNSSTGCVSGESAALTVYSSPSIQLSGAAQICIGQSTTFLPSSGGMWSSSDNTIATITNGGVVTGHNVGSATFTFVENGSGCISNPSEPVTVVGNPTASISGPNAICVDNTTTLSPSTGGSWVSTQPGVATVNNQGIVTGLSQGISSFIFTSDQGCSSNATTPITVFGKPNISIPGPSELCVDGTINLLPTAGGLWTSNDIAIATITNSGVVTGISPGTTTFEFTDTVTGCVSDESSIITVNANPTISILGNDTICVGNTTQLSPTVGGIWLSNDPSIAIINNQGVAEGINPGVTTFYFQNLSTQCVSDDSAPVTVEAKPVPQYTGDTELCVGDTTYIVPASGGTWQSDKPAVATISNNGMIITHGPGLARFKFTKTGSCSSNWSAPINVNSAPNVGFSGAPQVCIGDNAQLYPAVGGLWESSAPGIATVDNSGLVTGVNSGFSFFTFTDTVTGCASNGALKGTVLNQPTVTNNGAATICVGYTTTVSASAGGIWQSSDTRIAKVSNSGVVTGVAPGKAIIGIIDGTTGCFSGTQSIEITVEKCLYHDFNVTTTTMSVSGDLSTNDILANSVFDVIPVLESKPSGSQPSLMINTNGTYTFSASTPGKYIYQVDVCNDVVTFGCPSTTLEITVLGDVYSADLPVNNLEFATTFANSNIGIDGDIIDLNVLGNDRCVKTLGCDLDTSSLNIVVNAKHGANNVLSSFLDYYPLAGHLGEDTIVYEVCNQEGTYCSQSKTYITTNHPSAENSIVASDDFLFSIGSSPVNVNVLSNDSDPEGDSILVSPQGNPGAPIDISEGTYYIESNGDLTFTPDEGFVGVLDIVYKVCDNNAQQACKDATVHVLVLGDMVINLRVYLEGALLMNGGETSSTGRPLMRDGLRNSPYTGLNYIPATDPYSGSVGFLDLSSKFTHIGPGLLPENMTIPDSAGVFGVTGENAIVDWVYVQLRDKNDNTNILATRSGLVQRDGDVVDLDGVSLLKFDGVGLDSFYVVVKHRTHLGVMSGVVANLELVDFTDPDTEVFDFGTTLNTGQDFTGLALKSGVIQGYNALWMGDFDASGKIKFTNPGDDQNILFADVLFHPDNTSTKANFDFGYGYYQGDINLDGKVKFANPDDDKNILFSQLLLYPLNGNLQDNYNFFIEQIPE